MQKYDPETLYIFTHGYLSPAERNICYQSEALWPQAEYFYWRAMDYSGICIFNYMDNKESNNFRTFHLPSMEMISLWV